MGFSSPLKLQSQSINIKQTKKHQHQKSQEELQNMQAFHEMQSRLLNDRMLESNKSVSRAFGAERELLGRLRKSCALPPGEKRNRTGSDSSRSSNDSLDQILDRMHKIPVDSHTRKVIKVIERKLDRIK